MTGFSTTSTWMLPLLLLPIFISLHHSYVVRGPLLHEFTRNVDLFGLREKNCSKNCSSVHITDKICRCLNVSAGECGFPHRYIEGLKSLLPFSPNKDLINDLIDNLMDLNQTALMRKVCSMPVMYKTLKQALTELKDKINSMKYTTV